MRKKFINILSLILGTILLFPMISYAAEDCSSYTNVTCSSTTGAWLSSNNDRDIYRLDLSSGGKYVDIYTTGNRDTMGELYRTTCTNPNRIARNDDCARRNYNFCISRNLSAGVYFIAVKKYRNSSNGSYDLHVDCISDDHGNNCADATTVAPNSVTAGDIETRGDNDYFKVVAPSVGVLTVYTTGTTDTYGRYRNAACNSVRSNNNSGAGSNFKIEMDVTAGTYYFSVNENRNNDTGAYDFHMEFVSTVTWNISASVSGGVGGTISPAGTVEVSDGGSQSFNMTPSSGNTIQDVQVDSVSVGAVSSYAFSGVSADRSIEVTFALPPGLCTDLSQIPLDTKFRAAPANIMFVLDDSGSMDWEFMTNENDGLYWSGGNSTGSSHYYVFDDPGDNVYSGKTLSRGTDRRTWKTQWPGYNKLYYNPDVDYVSWPTLGNANPDNPRAHPKNSGTTFNLEGSFDTVANEIIVDDTDVAKFSKTPAIDEIIVDNSGTGFSIISEPVAGAWRTGEYSSQAHQGTYLFTDVDGTYSAKWSPSGLAAGVYDVYVIWHAENDNSDAVEYSLDLDGTTTVTASVDQSADGGTWEKIAANAAISAGYGSVTLTHTRGSSTDKAVADAVKYVPQGAYYWQRAEGDSDAYDEQYWYTSEAESGGPYYTYTATWTPNLSGDYRIYARWVDGTNRLSNATYAINHTGGTTIVTEDQRTNGGTWQQLGAGTFTLDSATSYVMLGHIQDAANYDKVVVADAIKFVPVTSTTINIKRAHYYVWSDLESKPYLIVLDGASSQILYYSVTESASGTDGVVESGELALSASPPADVVTSRSYTDERQNFANWYSFYRRRELTAAAGVSRTINQMQGVYVGINTINHRIQQPVLGVKAGSVDETSTLLNLLYNLTIRSNGTPLRQGLRDVGRYYDQDDNIKLNGSSGNDSPFAPEAEGGACQQAFAIAMTDGYYNGSSPSVGNQDSGMGVYSDSYSDTLADVAMKYYKEDLSNSLPNYIQGNEMDDANYQHMVTYGVSFGVRGNLVSRSENPVTYDYDFNDPADPAAPVYPTWPRPTSGDQEKIDDLLHASTNGRGLFLSASDPDSLIESLLTILKDVELRIGSASSVSVNGDELYEEVNMDLRVFQSSYDSENWSGNVQAFRVNITTGEVETASPIWEARDELQNQNWDSGRTIATYDGANGIPFRYGSLTPGMQAMLDSNATVAGNILNYLRGDNANEVEQGGSFKNRIYKLADIVHSSPAYKHDRLYVGGNDGMLHALNSNDGSEVFAYVPNLVFGELYKLTEPNYTHEYYVDLTPVVKDVNFTSGGSTVTTLLVGGLGRGGKGYYALDISAPDPGDPKQPPSIASESALAGKALWEYPDSSTPENVITITGATNATPIMITATTHGCSTGDYVEISGVGGNTAANGRRVITKIDDSNFTLDGSAGNGVYTAGGTLTYKESDDLGYTYARPVIVKSNNSGNWIVIFGNGYNSQNGSAVLFILDPSDGSVIRKIDTGVSGCNGLSSPVAIDANYDEKVDYVYAGDLLGNLWKFDLTDSSPSNWGSAYTSGSTPKPLFQAEGPGGTVQPITTRPDVMSMNHCSQDGYMILFGTGKYIGESDMSLTSTQTIYGIWDYGDDSDDSEYLGKINRSSSPVGLTNQASTISLLEQTEVYSVETYDVGSLTQEVADYTTAEDTLGPGTDRKPNPTANVGWFFDLPISGERVITEPLIRGGHAIIISYVPDVSPCSASGYSILNEINACTGGRLEQTPWDINENGGFDEPEFDVDGNLVDEGDYLIYDSTSGDSTTARGTKTDYTEIIAPARIKKAGRLMSPAIAGLGKNKEVKIMSSSTANVATQNIVTVIEKGPEFGIRYWFESQE